MKAFKLAVVPGFDLGEQDVLDALFKIGALVGGRFFPWELSLGCCGLLRFARRYCLGGKDKRQQKHGDQVKAHRMHCKAMGSAKLRYFSLVVSAN